VTLEGAECGLEKETENQKETSPQTSKEDAGKEVTTSRGDNPLRTASIADVESIL
jgi:hypothetical protein